MDTPLRCSVPVPPEFFQVRNRLREADMDAGFFRAAAIPALQEFSARLKKIRPRSEADELYYLWSQCLQAEIHDLLANYEAAEAAILGVATVIERKLREGVLDHKSKPLFRQRMWALIFFSHCLYRADDLDRARELLLAVRAEVDRTLPLHWDGRGGEPSFGLRARIAYSLGQVYRQLAHVAEARKEFLLAIELTRNRLIQKSLKYAAVDEHKVREQRYAIYVTGNALCFGLAWVSSSSGELQRARAEAVAGCTMLETTRDEVHKSYAQVIYAQILRAQARSIQVGQELPADLAEALRILQGLSDVEHSPLRAVPQFLARARFEFGRALYSAGRYQEAEVLARHAYENEPPGSRWHLAGGVTSIAVLLRTGRSDEALAVSDALMAIIRTATPPPRSLHAEILISRAEILMERPDSSLDTIHRLLSEAENLLEHNPLGLAVCHVHRARCFGLQGNLDSARREMFSWSSRAHAIEHAFVHELAERAEEEIQNRDPRFMVSPEELEGPEKLRGLENRLKWWSIQALYARYGEDYLKDPNPHQYLGVSGGTVRNWLTQLGLDPARPSKKRPG